MPNDFEPAPRPETNGTLGDTSAEDGGSESGIPRAESRTRRRFPDGERRAMTTMQEGRTNESLDGTSAGTFGGALGLAVGVLTVAIGLFTVAMPLLTGAVVSVWLGVLLVVLGGSRAEALKHRQSARFGDVAAELLRATGYVLVGVLIAMFPLEPSRLSVLLAVPLLLDGLDRLTGVLHRSANRRRSALLGVALVSIAALLVVRWPSDAAWALGTLFGIGLILVGVAAVAKSRASGRPEWTT